MPISGPCGFCRRGRFSCKHHLLVLPCLKKLDRKLAKTVDASQYLYAASLRRLLGQHFFQLLLRATRPALPAGDADRPAARVDFFRD